uniref:Formin-like protein n=1 Tax=Nelumbo nucifera TaxID=4432 RepID=A0A822ZK47_NELNU|nr:TPA_asm: hypothetical protein HUJ06_003478 [Nelumbo nucifera]
MALFRKLFYKKPPDKLLEISERVYVFDCCLSTDVLEEDDYRVYMQGIVGQLRDHFPDASFMVFNFREGDRQSQIATILLEYDMTVMDYPRQYEGCPLLSMEVIHHFMMTGDNWLSLAQKNVLLMHCERGGWPLLAFMLAGLLIYRKQCTGEQKTLDMIHKQAPRDLLQLLSPLNPLPSQLRYLQYVSRRNVGSEWPPLDRALTLDCVMFRVIPNFDGVGGCRPIFRIYGQDPFMVCDRTPKVLFSTPKKSKAVRLYKQADCKFVKIDIYCHIQGDVVLECISLDDDLEREEMMFRVMFNTAFIRSNILILSRDDIDILWNAKDRFPKEFRAEVLFSEMDTAASPSAMDLPCFEENEGLPMEAFAKVQEIFNNTDWLDPKADSAAINLLWQRSLSNILQERLGAAALEDSEIRALLRVSSTERAMKKLKPVASQNNIKIRDSMADAAAINLLWRRSVSNVLQEKLEAAALENAELRSLLQVSSTEKAIKKLKPVASENNINSTDPKADSAATNLLQKTNSSNVLQEKLEAAASENAENRAPLQVSSTEKVIKKLKPVASENDIMSTDPKADSAVINLLQQPSTSNVLQEKSEAIVLDNAKTRIPLQVSSTEKIIDKLKPVASENNNKNTMSVALQKQSMPSFKSSAGSDSPKRKVQPQDLQVALQRPTQSKIIAQRTSSCSLSNPVSYCNPLQVSPVPMSRYHSAPSTLGITALLHDHTSDGSAEATLLVTTPPPPSAPLVPAIPCSPKPLGSNIVSSIPLPPPPPLLPNTLIASTTITSIISHPQPPHCQPTLKLSVPSLTQHSRISSMGRGQLSSAPPPPPPPPPPPSCSGLPLSVITTSDSVPSCPPPVPPCSGSTVGNLSSAPPPPPPLFPPKTGFSDPSSPHPPPSPMKKPGFPAGPPLPPPPPIPSGLSPGSINVSLAPPPPPPPGFSSQSSGPPVPPPPAPFPNGVSRTGDGSQFPSAGNSGTGGVAPPPGPPFGAKGRGLPRITSSKNQPKRTTLKPLHWFKLTRAIQGSLWDEISKCPGVVEMPELENLFSAAVPNSERRGSDGSLSRASSAGRKSDKVQLIDLRRANNCEIMLSKVKIPLPDLLSSVLALDESAMDIDQVDNLIKFCPTKEEMDKLKGYDGDKENLGRCEQFFLEMMKVPRVESKLRVFSFKIQFPFQVSDLRVSLNVVNAASNEIKSSMRLKSIMKTILQLGNALNHGTARAVGFRLDSLLKLSDTRSRNNKMTLMHYLCKVLADKLPELIYFHKDLFHLEAASKIQLKFLAEEMQAISKGLEKVEQELTASENDGPISQTFCKTLKNFLVVAEAEVRSLASLYAGVGRNADALAVYFGEDPTKCPFEQVVATLLNFVRMFERAHEENIKQSELEKKKALKEAENEKTKNAAQRNSEQLSQARINHGSVK